VKTFLQRKQKAAARRIKVTEAELLRVLTKLEYRITEPPPVHEPISVLRDKRRRALEILMEEE